MDGSSSHDDKGVGSSTGLSLREQLRIKAQQKLRSKPSSPPSRPTDITTADLLAASDNKSDDEELGSLTFGRGAKRQAALKRPATYNIDPTDDATRLKSDPRGLSSTLTASTATPLKKPKTVESLLREKQRKAKAGTDADGFSRAEEIALTMERERLEMLGISSSNHQSDSDVNGAKDDQDRQKLTVKALSPSVPSFIWSSHSESGDSEDDVKSEADEPDLEREARTMAASLAAAEVDDEMQERTMGILHQDERASSKETGPNHIAFFRPGRTYALRLEAYDDVSNPLCLKRKPASPSQATSAPTPANVEFSDEAWAMVAPHILLSGTLPPSLKLSSRQLSQIIVWSALSYMLERDVMQSRLRLAFFRSLIFDPKRSHYRDQLEKEVPKALSEIIRWIPHLFNDLGVSENVIEECFPHHSYVTDDLCPLVTTPKSQRDAAASLTTAQDASKAKMKKGKPYLTQTEREDILINLASIVGTTTAAACERSADFVVKHLSLLAGYVSCMTIGVAASTNLTLHESVSCAMRTIFTATSEAGSTTCKELQAQVVDRTLSALGTDDIAIRARLVEILPADVVEARAIKRWIAWVTITQHLADTLTEKKAGMRESPKDEVPSSDPVEALETIDSNKDNAYWRRVRFEPLALDLSLLTKAVDMRDAKSPFHIPLGGSGAIVAGPDFEMLVSATSLLATALSDLPVHLCSFANTHQRSASTNIAQHSRALQLALAPYAKLEPQLDQERVQHVRTIIDRLNTVNSHIRDVIGDVVFRSMAKDAMQRLALVLEYQLHSFDPASSNVQTFLQ